MPPNRYEPGPFDEQVCNCGHRRARHAADDGLCHGDREPRGDLATTCRCQEFRLPDPREAASRDQPFTIAQMIAALKKLPPEALLYVPGFEEGIHDALPPTLIEVVRNHYTASGSWWHRPYMHPRHLYSGTDTNRSIETGYFIGVPHEHAHPPDSDQTRRV